MSHNGVRDIDTSDFFSYERLLTDDERHLLHAVRKFMTTDVAPVILEHWSRATFPFEVVPGVTAGAIRPEMKVIGGIEPRPILVSG